MEWTNETVNREHKRSEGTLSSQAGPYVLCLLLLLLLCQNLVRVLAGVGGRVGICDMNIKDSRRAPPPEPVGCDVAM